MAISKTNGATYPLAKTDHPLVLHVDAFGVYWSGGTFSADAGKISMMVK